ncbi:TetR/AcrR family transcriptional regulator [Pseudobacter ginsenosidimutans]|uniref:TetR family transcriptional regulator n=1 Tax=Pseudobacter ginsenosidimutans TaxID=661488 RepID=A0A4Q7N146_9BACT|nr:TetR/AcrR family transcriptional regulator [Pseudobacter ginsenosidimutans]QEC43514.1 TetR/AcrR family transcriptional regulator [Pseudobacter ginsenosidimutans]RZS74902.1 TetR family transcriptional regulator [Pseudobacter ginsenosidimutans]
MSNSQVVKDPVREEILRKAAELLGRFGFKKTTMEDIARAIGKSKSALYYYYKTKEEIFEAVVAEDMDESRCMTEEKMNSVESAPEKFRLMFTTIFGSIREKIDKFSVFRADVMENPALMENIGKERDVYMENLLRNLVLYGIERGEIRKMTDEEISVWTKVTNMTMRAIGQRLFLEDNFAYVEKHLDFLAATMLNGIVVKK